MSTPMQTHLFISTFLPLRKDDNHKPEMAVAVREFEALCNFRPAAEIAHFLKTVPGCYFSIIVYSVTHILFFLFIAVV
jgi:hypothetical protein